jgi:hypothetical protein
MPRIYLNVFGTKKTAAPLARTGVFCCLSYSLTFRLVSAVASELPPTQIA